MAVDLFDATTWVRGMVPLAPTAACIRAYVDNARLFFRETQAWREVLSATSVADAHEVVLTPPSGSEIIDAAVCIYDTAPLEKRSITQQLRDDADDKASTPKQFAIVPPSTLYLSPKPRVGGAAIRIETVLAPSLDATTIDQTIAEKYRRALEYGAAAHLLWQVNQPWFDATAAQLYHAVYETERDLWRSRAADGGMTGTVRRVKYGGI